MNKKYKPGWKMVKFGDLVRQCKESVDRDNNPFERYVEGGHMDSDNIHIRRWGEFGEDYVGPAFHRIFRKGQVLYGSRRTYLKKVALAEFDGITANTTFVLETKDQTVLMQELLPFIMLTESFTDHSIRESKGSTNPYINWPDIAKFEFPLPPIEEQKRIAEILWTADEAVEKYSKVEQALVSQQRALISLQMPSDVPFRILNKGKIPGINASKLKDVCEKITDGTHQSPPFSKNGVPFLLISNVKHGQVDWNVSKWVSEGTYAQLTKTTKPERGDVLYTVVASYGDAVLVDWDHSFSFQRHIAIIKPKRGVLDGKFLCHFLKSVLGRKQAEIYAEGLAQKTITLKSLGQFCVPTPPIEIQNAICRELDLIEESKKKIQNLISTCRDMIARASDVLIIGIFNV